jgi:hypothetical protein
MGDTVVSPLRTLAEASAYLRTPVQTLRYWRQVGKGPRSMKIGASVMYRQSDLDAYIERQAAALRPEVVRRERRG